nr:MAG TPA: protein of unknown function (DUF4514) [Caudoviricetes sp.]
MPPRDYAGATPAGSEKLKQEEIRVKHCLIGAALGASASLAVTSVVLMDAWNVAFYWVIVAAYWGIRLAEEFKEGR